MADLLSACVETFRGIVADAVLLLVLLAFGFSVVGHMLRAG